VSSPVCCGVRKKSAADGGFFFRLAFAAKAAWHRIGMAILPPCPQEPTDTPSLGSRRMSIPAK